VVDYARWISPTPKVLNLAALRVSLVATALIEFVLRLPYSKFLYTNESWFLNQPNSEMSRYLALGRGLDSYIGTIFVVLCLFVLTGFGGRWSLVGLTAALTYLQERNSYIINGGDQYLRLILFYLCFSNSFARLTIFKPRHSESTTQNMLDRLVLVSIVLQLCLVYFSSGWAKMQTDQWRHGQAYYYVVAAAGCGGDFLFRLVRQFPVVSKILTYATLCFELGFPFLIAIRSTRRLALIAGCIFHLMIASTMNLFAFQAYFIISYIVFVDSSKVEMVLGRICQLGDSVLHRRQPTSIG